MKQNTSANNGIPVNQAASANLSTISLNNLGVFLYPYKYIYKKSSENV